MFVFPFPTFKCREGKGKGKGKAEAVMGLAFPPRKQFLFVLIFVTKSIFQIAEFVLSCKMSAAA